MRITIIFICLVVIAALSVVGRLNADCKKPIEWHGKIGSYELSFGASKDPSKCVVDSPTP